MRLTFALPFLCLLAAPALAQTPLDKLLEKVPSLFGSPSGPRVALPPTPDIPALTRPAERTAAGDPATFDLGGFRLGMSEAAIDANVRARRLKAAAVTRFVDFESQVRSRINARGGVGGGETKRGALGEATLQDDAGGRYMLKLLVWPDGSHLSEITYLAPEGTSVVEWRRMLTEKWGRPREEKVGDQLRARWGSGAWNKVTARADLGPRGGTVTITSPDGVSEQPTRLVEQAADAFIAGRAKKPTL